jgi:hypothetical protein
MAEYRFTSDGGVVRNSDGARIPNDPANPDWIKYQVWLVSGGWMGAGGIPDPCVPLPDDENRDCDQERITPSLAVSEFITNAKMKR